MVAGTNAIVLPEYDPTKALDLIDNFNISKIFLVPAAIQILLNHPRVNEVDFSRLKYVTYGASPIPLELMREAMRVLGCGFVQMYGMTETSGTIVYLPPEDHDVAGTPRMAGCGKPFPDVELRIVGEDGQDRPTGDVGEVWVRAPNVVARYWPDLPKVVAFDEWLANPDRNMGNLIYVAQTLHIIDHAEAFGDAEPGASLWALAVSPQASHPGIGEALTRYLAEHFQAAC